MSVSPANRPAASAGNARAIAGADRSPTGDGGHTDIIPGGWIDRRMPAAVRPYLRLARLDRPIGTWLLLFPCWWSIALATHVTVGASAVVPALREKSVLPLQDPWLRDLWQADIWLPGLWLMLLFGIGAVVMRGAGCTVNDILDRDIDAKVERTRGRPLPSGQVTVRQALAFLALLLGIGLGVLVQLRTLAIGLGVGSLVLVFTYPLMKRITWWPQAFLGLTFNWGALLGWAAAADTLALPALLLYGGGIAWTLGYDTIYAHQDKEDDARVGVKSTALRLGAASRHWVAGFYAAAVLLWMLAGMTAGAGGLFLLGLAGASAQMAWQVATWDPDSPADCLRKFKSNRVVGWIVLVAIIVDAMTVNFVP